MQDKICPTCNERYYKFIDYCFKDGTKLVLPGEEIEVEETELLSQAQRISPNESTATNQNDGTETFSLNITKPTVSDEANVVDEELEDPLALGNTQMLRKEDLLAMFHDDSTYNGEIVEREDDSNSSFEALETEDMETP